MSLFKKAVKSAAKLRLAIAGPSGSGKTYTALSIATALANGRPIALVDTEHGSASKYAGLFDFDVAEMHPPFHPDKFIAAIQEAQEAGYAVVILDSVTHAWAGTGGVLDIVDEAAKRSRSGNTYMAWKEGTPVQNRLIDAIVQSGLHVIVTMRSKTDYILVDTGNGKQAPRKVGMAPVQRDQFEYEFDIVFDMDIENNAVVTKTRCPALTGRVFSKPGADVAKVLREWLSDGAPAQEQRQIEQSQPEQLEVEYMEPQPDPTAKLLQQFGELGKELYGDQWTQVSRHNAERVSDGQASDPGKLTVDQLQKLITGLESLKKKRQTNGNGKRAGQITDVQRNTLHALGMALYGNKADWDGDRATMVSNVTSLRTSSSSELWQTEAAQLITHLEESVRKAYETLADQLAAGLARFDPNVLAEIDQLHGVELANAYKELRKLQPEPAGK